MFNWFAFTILASIAAFIGSIVAGIMLLDWIDEEFGRGAAIGTAAFLVLLEATILGFVVPVS